MAPDRNHIRHRGNERGEALIESIMSVLVLCLIAIAGYAGFSTSIRQTSTQRFSAGHETALRSAAEQLQSPDLAYIPRAGCSGASQYVIPPTAGTTTYTVTVTTVSFWTGASATPVTAVTPAFTSTCPATATADPGLQRLVLRSVAPDGTTDTLTITKRRT